MHQLLTLSFFLFEIIHINPCLDIPTAGDLSPANTQTKLRTLDIGNNEIEVIENVSHLKDLEEFWASYNKIESLANLHEELGGLPNLETVYLEGNPCQMNDMAGYRRKIMLALPQVQQIDAT